MNLPTEIIILPFLINLIWVPHIKSHWLISIISIYFYSVTLSYILLFIYTSRVFSHITNAHTIYIHVCAYDLIRIEIAKMNTLIHVAKL